VGVDYDNTRHISVTVLINKSWHFIRIMALSKYERNMERTRGEGTLNSKSKLCYDRRSVGQSVLE
jgi:hypothetical protein